MTNNRNMQKEKLEAMIAGRDLDALIATKVMGLPVWRDEYETIYPPYSVDIAAAFEVVEKLRAQGLTVTISTPLPDCKSWDVRGWNSQTNDNRFIAHADTAPLAICLAALKAVGHVD